jgi:hypothetical protein
MVLLKTLGILAKQARRNMIKAHFEDLDPDLAQSFLEASPEYSPYETSIEESTPQKISVKFHMRLYPDAASENKSPTPDEAQLRKVLKILVMDVSCCVYGKSISINA